MLLLLIKGKVRVIYDKIKGIKRHEGQKTVGGMRKIASGITSVKGVPFPTFNISSALSAITSIDFYVIFIHVCAFTLSRLIIFV